MIRLSGKTYLAFGLTAFVTAVGSYIVWTRDMVIAKQQRTIDVLSSERASMSASIAHQKECSEQARLFLKSTGWDVVVKDKGGYENHFNKRLGKCFVEIDYSDFIAATGWRYKLLFDAYEGRAYGSYSWHSDKVKKYWEVPPFDCTMYPDGKQGNLKACESETQFDDFVSQYMEN